MANKQTIHRFFRLNPLEKKQQKTCTGVMVLLVLILLVVVLPPMVLVAAAAAAVDCAVVKPTGCQLPVQGRYHYTKSSTWSISVKGGQC